MKSERFLVDATVWVAYLRGTDARLRERLAPLALEDRAVTCDVTILEILRGARSEKDYRLLRDLLLSLPRVDLDQAVWEQAWKLSYLLRKKGLTVPMADVLLAAAAMRHQLTILHADRHFDLMARHTELKTAAVQGLSSP